MTEEEICEQFPKVMHRLGKVSVGIILGELTENEFVALNVIHGYAKEHKEVKGIYVSMLVAAMKSSGPAISRLLRTLEERNLVERSVDRRDRRNTFVSITEEGERLRTVGTDRLGKLIIAVIHRMGNENMETMLDLFQNFAGILEEETKGMEQKLLSKEPEPDGAPAADKTKERRSRRSERRV